MTRLLSTMGTLLTNPRTQRGLGSTRNAGRVAVCVTAGAFPPGSCLHCGRSQDLFGGIVARGTRDAPAWVCARAAQIQPTDRRCIARPTRYRPQREQLVETQVAMKNIAAGQAVFALQVERREGVYVLDRPANVGRIAGQQIDRPIDELLFRRRVP